MPTIQHHIDALKLRRAMGRDEWLVPFELGLDSWKMLSRDGGSSVIVSCSDEYEEGVLWVHASIARNPEMPTYADLVNLHAAVWGTTGYAFQVFAPPSAHVNLHPRALHLWGRLDGQMVHPDFGRWGTI